MEYWAELSTAFLGLGGTNPEEEYNKWFPLNREQIKSHDPRAYQVAVSFLESSRMKTEIDKDSSLIERLRVIDHPFETRAQYRDLKTLQPNNIPLLPFVGLENFHTSGQTY